MQSWQGGNGGQHLVPGAAHDGGEHGARGVVPGEAALDHAGAIVAHERGHLSVVSHLCLQPI